MNVQMANVAWGNFNHRHPLEASVFKKLARLGLSPALCRKLVRNLTPETDMKQAWKESLLELSNDLPLLQDDVTAHGGVFAFVGPAGVGKTTTIAKIATRFVLEHGAENLALITTDSFRIAGHEQLSTLGRILKVPVRVVTEQQSLEHILRGLSRKKLILIDTAGLSHKDQVHREQMAMLESMGANIQRWLVLSSTSQRRILDKAISEYKHLNLEGCILTKLDESASLGEALSVAIESQLPIAYITDGQNIPNDIERPQATRLINHAIALAKEYHMDDALVADMYSDAMAEMEPDLAYG
jgi:flagellar biosynthesis protein FlhF